MFIDKSVLLSDNPKQLNYGIAVIDVDGDGAFELFVSGFGSRNLVLKWQDNCFVNLADDVLADDVSQSIGVAGGDLDGDGREEIYVLNTDTFSGRKRFGDRLFDWQNDAWKDLFSLPQNQDALNLTAGRSVVWVDRTGQGRYGCLVANYGGPMRLFELNADGMLADMAPAAGLNLSTGGRGLIALPLVSTRMDIVAVNENSANFLFRNQGDGTFAEIAAIAEMSDPYQHGRGIAVLDANDDGRFDLVYGNWEGPHRLFVQQQPGKFRNVAPPALAIPSRIRTVIVADFDNDGYEELFFNNIGQPNRLFGWRDGTWSPINIGDALEPNGLGTGAAVGDFNHDGRLELVIAHGESAAQPLSLYHSAANDHAWLRVLPLTPAGAPARGAVVTLTAGDRTQIRAIDAGSGYLCQMEPVAHFGLGTQQTIDGVEVRWLDGKTTRLRAPAANQLLRVPHPNTSA
ncbi:CRTAC1 family protein [Oculatella sp. LEGE 06141]|uniref:CRTAC1 family protein n=1 Tax=Oculatella sp. LEGE 06141 TaxID=1828648 RepID=UPI00187EA328|nr:CRTAC1 family protein [Oculatella sp. LEGE 06141]MBE9182090.1 CRTAC1 family protein [Oculatella sp. LEGE 06141]